MDKVGENARRAAVLRVIDMPAKDYRCCTELGDLYAAARVTGKADRRPALHDMPR